MAHALVCKCVCGACCGAAFLAESDLPSKCPSESEAEVAQLCGWWWWRCFRCAENGHLERNGAFASCFAIPAVDSAAVSGELYAQNGEAYTVLDICYI